nr:TBP-assosiated factor 13 [Cryptomonas sp.]
MLNMKVNCAKRNKKKFKYFNLVGLKENNFLISPKFLFLKYCIFKKKLFIYKRSKFCIQKKNFLSSEIAEINFGFGDSDIPLRKTIINIEHWVTKYLLNIISSICYISFWRTSKRPSIHDIMFLFRNDSRKFERIKYLLKMKNLIQMVMGSGKKTPINCKKT